MHDICYWCGKPATTREHVPPRCFFPDKDKEDISNIEFHWENLLTVPSCHDHNTKKSLDDEYLLAHIAPARNTNGYGLYKTAFKIMRSVKRNRKLIECIGTNESYETKGTFIKVRCDDIRLCRSLEAIARALFFHKCGVPFWGRCFVYYPYDINDENVALRNGNVLQILEQESSQWVHKVEGIYPEVFKYHFSGFDQHGCACFLMTFYENVKVAVIMGDIEHVRQRQRLPQELGIQNINRLGIRPEFFLFGDQGYNGYRYDEDSKNKFGH